MSELFTKTETDALLEKAVDFLMACFKRPNFGAGRPDDDNIVFLTKKDCRWKGTKDPAELVISFISLDKNGIIPEKNFIGHISSPFCDIAFTTVDFETLRKKLENCLEPV